MAVQGGEDAYVTLLLSDSYLPGALVLAHSLRDAGTTKKLAVLVTLETVAAEVITQLKAVYDYVIPVPTIRNDHPANLYLMNRPDLHSAFTKINLWKQTQFRKLVYIDADVVAYRAPDELFAIEHPFSAAPDIGWPDLFNTGVMVLTPNMGDYYALMAMAERGISFDGADQGLLNMHFRNSYNRLSFTYNVTPSAHYQYVPAYRHFQSSINLVHFIGADKPWIQGRKASTGSGPFDEMVGRWWAVYDRHYRANSVPAASTQPPPEIIQYFVKGEYQPKVSYTIPIGEPPENSQPYQQQYQQQQQQHGSSHYGQEHHQHHTPPQSENTPHIHHEHQQGDQHHYYQPPGGAPEHHKHHHHEHHEHHHRQEHDAHHDHQQHHYQSPPSGDTHHYHPHAPHSEPPQFEGASAQPAIPSFSPVASSSFSTSQGPDAEAPQDQVQGHHHWAPHAPAHEEHKPEKPQPPPMEPSWDAQRQPPPPESKPEAMNFPQMHYEMSSDTAPFVPPERYPSPPKNMWYEVPKEPPAPPQQKPPPIFPWERNRPPPTRVFNDESPAAEPAKEESATESLGQSGGHVAPYGHYHRPGAPAETSLTVSSISEQRSEPGTPATPTIPTNPPVTMASDPWATFTLTNAWDDVPEIERYVGSLQRHRRGKGLGSAGLRLGLGGDGEEFAHGFGRRGLKLTDFPSESERPSLPVTPAPVRRPRFWGGGDPGAAGGDGGGDQLLPAARGVPQQSDWVCVHGVLWGPADCLCDLTNLLRYYKDPVAQLQKLAKQQSELLLQRLGHSELERQGKEEGEGKVEKGQSPPAVASEGPKSPKYVAHASTVLSPTPLKPGSAKSPVQSLLDAGAEDEASVPRSVSEPPPAVPSSVVPEPSYHGPGPAWEKGEDILQKETPMPPKDEDRDVLET